MIKAKPFTLSEAEIEQHKEKHGPLKLVTLSHTETEEDQDFIIRTLRRDESFVIAETSNQSLKKANDLLINTCVLSGNMDLVKEDDGYWSAILEEITDFNEEQKKVKPKNSRVL